MVQVLISCSYQCEDLRSNHWVDFASIYDYMLLKSSIYFTWGKHSLFCIYFSEYSILGHPFSIAFSIQKCIKLALLKIIFWWCLHCRVSMFFGTIYHKDDKNSIRWLSDTEPKEYNVVLFRMVMFKNTTWICQLVNTPKTCIITSGCTLLKKLLDINVFHDIEYFEK